MVGVLAAVWLIVGGCASVNSETSYTLETGFFGNYRTAKSRAAEVESLLGNARVDASMIHRQPVYRVYSGAYATPQAANADLAKLQKAGIEARAVRNLR